MNPRFLQGLTILMLQALFLWPLSVHAETYVLREQLSIPKDLPAHVAQEALRARILLDGLKKLHGDLTERRNIAFQFSPTSYPALALMLNTISIDFEQREKSTVTAVLKATPSQAMQEKLAWSVTPDLLEAFDGFLRNMETLILRFDRHWPGGRLYTERLIKDLAPLPEEPALRDEDWLCLASHLEGLWLGLCALQGANENWLCKAKDLPALERAISLKASDPWLLTLLAEARLIHDLPQLAVKTATSALTFAPELERARYIRALAHWQLQQFGLAENDLTMILQNKEISQLRRLPYLRARGAVRLFLGRFEGMCQDFADACSLGDCDGLKHARSLSHCLPSTQKKPGD